MKTEANSEDRTTFHALLHGMVEPSLLSVGTSIAVLVVAFASYCLVFGSNFTASRFYRLQMADTQDVQTLVTHKVLSRANSGQPGIVILGTSVPVRCVESEELITRLVEEKTGTRLVAHDLATDAQSTWEMAAILDRLQPGPGSVIVIALTPGVLETAGYGPDGHLRELVKWPKLGFTSAAFDEEARRAGVDVPVRTGIHAIDNAGFILSRRKVMLKNLLWGGYDYADPLTAPWYDHVNRPEFWNEEIARIGKHAKAYVANSQSNYEVIRRFVERLRETRDIRVVIMEAPVNPGWFSVPAGAEFFGRYRDDLKRFADGLDANFISATDSAELTRSDFVDFEGHLGNAQARRRCSEVISLSVAQAIGVSQ
ncbi:hypothetical protein OEZ71_19670 [Defluviimonas sp. WL0050]|uniref:SGNH/GDSL hydrolase family protein n=1 Tax=Albidovulum litorale TaxID=2984134 RepID=A0ABT2ZTQ1_9RHOB|nr:hypothetical protein [Defluviimonas sp. WL0050]MCV2874524.1 hypothetical protein [Defluviimonas sp. WL0050]